MATQPTVFLHSDWQDARVNGEAPKVRTIPSELASQAAVGLIKVQCPEVWAVVEGGEIVAGGVVVRLVILLRISLWKLWRPSLSAAGKWAIRCQVQVEFRRIAHSS